LSSAEVKDFVGDVENHVAEVVVPPDENKTITIYVELPQEWFYC